MQMTDKNKVVTFTITMTEPEAYQVMTTLMAVRDQGGLNEGSQALHNILANRNSAHG